MYMSECISADCYILCFTVFNRSQATLFPFHKEFWDEQFIT